MARLGRSLHSHHVSKWPGQTSCPPHVKHGQAPASGRSAGLQGQFPGMVTILPPLPHRLRLVQPAHRGAESGSWLLWDLPCRQPRPLAWATEVPPTTTRDQNTGLSPLTLGGMKDMGTRLPFLPSAALPALTSGSGSEAGREKDGSPQEGRGPQGAPNTLHLLAPGSGHRAFNPDKPLAHAHTHTQRHTHPTPTALGRRPRGLAHHLREGRAGIEDPGYLSRLTSTLIRGTGQGMPTPSSAQHTSSHTQRRCSLRGRGRLGQSPRRRSEVPTRGWLQPPPPPPPPASTGATSGRVGFVT